ncbi:hypothetical protein [Aeromonas veronii]|uniref:hypothetical protein n=1 Tax=Aeromonas veronii TaxID=654 RepID=UPI0024159AA1|nr:hypothetical protein [Aeromonas veronii]WFO52749.1 hypothetical protein L1O00_06965 [Aeromonas veronii]
MNTYQISTIKDVIAQIPPEKLDAFFRDMQLAVVQHQKCIQAYQTLFGDEGREQYLKAMKNEMVWVDDGKADTFTNVQLNGHDVAKVTVEYQHNKQS